MESRSEIKELHPSFLKQILSLMEYISFIGLRHNRCETVVHNSMVFFQRLLLNNENDYIRPNSPGASPKTISDTYQNTDTLIFSALASIHLAFKVQ